MARAWRVLGQPVRHRDHQGVAAGAETEFHGGGVQQNPVARLGTAGQRRVGERPQRTAGCGDFQLNRSRPFAACTHNDRVSPSNHRGRVPAAVLLGLLYSSNLCARLYSGSVNLTECAQAEGTQVMTAEPQAVMQISGAAVGGIAPGTNRDGNLAGSRALPGCHKPRRAPGGRGRMLARPAREKAAMSRRKTERLLSLVVCLLSSQRYLTATQIRAAVPGYPESFDAFKRMFERDAQLDMGTNAALDDEVGYRIPRQAYELPDIRLEPDEAAVLAVAARVWHRAELAGAAAGA